MDTDPVCGEYFYGRKKELETLTKRIKAFEDGYRQNIGLIGSRTVGKSSLLLQFLTTLNSKCLPLYVEVLAEPFDYFAQRFMGCMLAAHLKERTGIVPSEFNDLVLENKKYIPKTLRHMGRIKRLLGKESFDEAFKEILALPQTLSNETGKKMILILDNFDSLADLSLKDPFGEFGRAVMVQLDTVYIVTSRRRNRAEQIFQKKLSLLFGNFELIPLDVLDFKTVREFIHAYLGKRAVSDELVRLISDFTDGHPYFLRILLEKIREIMRSVDLYELSEPLLIQAIENIFFRRSGALYQYFVSLLSYIGRDKGYYTALKILYAISLGHKSQSQIVKTIKRKPDEIKKTLVKLLEEELVEKKGSFYCIQWPSFKFWLAAVYPLRNLNYSYDDRVNAEAFHEQVRQSFLRRRNEDAKELNQRVEDLFKSFRNDLLDLEPFRMRLPHFRKVHFKPSNERYFPVEAETESGKWLCQLAQTEFTEDDVRLFLDETKSFKAKSSKRVLILMNGIDVNAKILAKEAGVVLWRLKDLNCLFDLYDKPKVIQ